MHKIFCGFRKRNKNSREFFPFFREWRWNTLRKFVTCNDKNMCDRESTCYQAILKSQIRLTEIFSNLVFLGSLESCDRNAAMVVSEVLNIREHVDCGRVF